MAQIERLSQLVEYHALNGLREKDQEGEMWLEKKVTV